VTASDLVQHESMSEEPGIYYAGESRDPETRDEQEKKALAADGVAIS